MKTKQAQSRPETKQLVVYQGKGTPWEKRIETGITLYWCETLQKYVSIPDEMKLTPQTGY